VTFLSVRDIDAGRGTRHNGRMTDLTAPVLDELRAANGKLINEIDGPNKTQLQFWAVPRRGMIVVQIFPNGGFEIFRPLTQSNEIGATLEALQACFTD
jgi:hypothetical protein